MKNKNKKLKFIKLVGLISLIGLIIIPINVFALGVQGRVGTPLTGGSGETPPPPPPQPPPPPADTTPPVISNIVVNNITSTGADISWSTNEASSSFVDYGLTQNYGSSVQGATSTIAHSTSLTSLAADTTYHFRVRSADTFGNEAFSLDQNFITLKITDSKPPVISNILITKITGTSATINWTTDELSTSSLDFGETTNYEIGTVSTSTFLTAHEFVLQNLLPETTYHFRVLARDQAGNSTTSADNTFTTLDIGAPSIISGPTISEITPTGATVSWSTNELTTGIIFYRLGAATQQQITDKTLIKNHSLVLKNLIAGSEYIIYVRAIDKAGNKADSGAQTFKTLADKLPPANVSDLTSKAGDGTLELSWTNPLDLDFARVQVQRSAVSFPANPEDGTTVFTGRAETFTDKGLTNNVTYYYTVFTFDTSGNSSSGALLTGTPSLPPPVLEVPSAPPEAVPSAPAEIIPGGPAEVAPLPGAELPPTEVVPPVGISPAPPIVTPSITVPERAKLKPNIFNFRTAGRTVSIIPSENNIIKLGPRAFLSISIHSSKLAGDPKRVILNLMSSSYLFASTDGFFETGIYLPAATGKYPASIIIEYTDGATDVVDLTILIDPYGYVYEIKNGRLEKISGAEVVLFKLEGDSWQEWDATPFAQINPQITGDDGTFAFFVPAGTYYLRAGRDGYRDNNTNRFDVIDTIVNINIELIVTPKIPEVKIQNTAELLRAAPGVLRFVSKVAGQEVAQFAANPVVDEVNSKVAVPGVVAAAAVNTVTAVSVFNLWSYLQYVVTQPILLLRRRKRFGWGVVYNAISRVPVDLAIVRLYQLISPIIPISPIGPTGQISPISPIGPSSPIRESWKLVQTRVTGKDGKFIFFISPGKYKIEISKQNFVYPSDYLKNIKIDEPYSNLYHGEILEVTEAKVLTPSVPVDPVEEKLPAGKLLRRKIFQNLRQGLSFGGIIFSGASFAITPTSSVGLMVAVHLLLYLLLRRLAIPRALRAFGIVYDAKTNQPLKAVIARIFETAYNKLLATQISDAAGRYAFLVGKNTYYITYDRAGYESKKTEVIDLSNIREPQIVAPNTALKSLEPSMPPTDIKGPDSVSRPVQLSSSPSTAPDTQLTNAKKLTYPQSQIKVKPES